MGRGDIKSKRGKIARGSYGKTRPKQANKPVPVAKQPEAVPEVEA
ncbi:30S ribosomal protein THX [Spirosoma fluviale]|uniref:Ribosomal small subunit protein bTHX n=1 Tax=Spirosoma fluviale TaxID=1597977 RepID=A0A286FHQ3_9BACT|nr:30S ribosomal protein THX [Spirosoma fluviale]SOD82755.1 ribosomal small subunit protein bTHX [Spirosoma fluviale]